MNSCILKVIFLGLILAALTLNFTGGAGGIQKNNGFFFTDNHVIQRMMLTDSNDNSVNLKTWINLRNKSKLKSESKILSPINKVSSKDILDIGMFNEK